MTPSFLTTRLTQRSTWTGAIALLALAIAVAFALNHRAVAADKKAPPRAPPPVQVTTAPVMQQNLPVFRAGIGTVTAAQSVTVKARIDGQLDSVGFTEGQDVKAGQVLARIDPRTLQASLAQAKAQRAKDAAMLQNAQADLQRYTTLIGEDASTQQQVDTQKALVAQLQATVQTDDALINYAQVQLSFTTIVAPISGRVGVRLVDPGNIVHAADTNGLVVINQVDPITVLFTLPEEAFGDVNKALNASRTPLVVQAYPRAGSELIGTGKLLLVNNQIDTTSGTVQLKAVFNNPKHSLWPGQFVNIRLVLGARDGALTVPAAAVQRSQDGLYTYVVDPATKTVKSQVIEVAQTQDGVSVVTKGLSAGQHVVTDGQYKLKPGATVVEAAPRAAGSASAASGANAAPTSAAPTAARANT